MLIDSKVQLAQLVVEGSRIVSVSTDEREFRGADERLEPNHVLSPGFIDIQINGAFGKEFKTDIDAIPHIGSRLPEFGTTAFCATVTTMPLHTYPEHLRSLAAAPSDPKGAKFLGFHLEGPALSSQKVGAQSKESLVEPSGINLDDYVTPDVRMVTFAPELDGATFFAKSLRDRGIKVGVGHSLVDYDSLVHLFEPDDMMIVHAFNAMADMNSRLPGVAGALLDRDDYYASIIADRIHVSDPTLRVFWKAKRDKSRVVAITDGSAVTGLPTGVHTVGARKIEKRADRAVLSGTETLVGSTLTLDVAVQNLIAVTQCTIGEALMCVTNNPACFLGVEDEFGTLDAGSVADMVVLDEELSVVKTIIDGEVQWVG